VAEKDVIISEQEELLEERGNIITKQVGHIAGLKTEMEENDKYLSDLVDGNEQVCFRLKKNVLFYYHYCISISAAISSSDGCERVDEL
jgi:hypothetical protein